MPGKHTRSARSTWNPGGQRMLQGRENYSNFPGLYQRECAHTSEFWALTPRIDNWAYYFVLMSGPCNVGGGKITVTGHLIVWYIKTTCVYKNTAIHVKHGVGMMLHLWRPIHRYFDDTFFVIRTLQVHRFSGFHSIPSGINLFPTAVPLWRYFVICIPCSNQRSGHRGGGAPLYIGGGGGGTWSFLPGHIYLFHKGDGKLYFFTSGWAVFPPCLVALYIFYPCFPQKYLFLTPPPSILMMAPLWM